MDGESKQATAILSHLIDTFDGRVPGRAELTRPVALRLAQHLVHICSGDGYGNYTITHDGTGTRKIL